MKNRDYFPHYTDERNWSETLQLRMRHGSRGYGVYCMIKERLGAEPDHASVKDYNMIAFDLREDAGLIKSVVEDFGLFAFTEDGECFYSEGINESMAARDEAYRRKADAGRKGMSRRWGKNDNTVITQLSENDNTVITQLSENDNTVITQLSENDNKISKVKKSKEKPPLLPARAREPSADDKERDWLDTLKCNTQFVETLAINKGVTCDAVVVLIEEFHAECAAKGIAHNGYGDYRRHCYDWARIHLDKQKQKDKQNGSDGKRREDRRGESDFSSTSAKDYKTTF